MQQAISPTKVHGPGTPNRTVWLWWASVAAFLTGMVLLMSVLPMQEIGQRLGDWVSGLGVWGPIVFAAIYIVATVLMIPGSALTLAAGAVFGLWIGMVTASLASTTGAAAAFLIGRYLARDRVAGIAKAYPVFKAIDQALGQGGWKVVALLRLSPVIPFNVQNYLYGLTAIRFGPAVLASWIAMLPGTFLYVYLGYAGRQAAGAIGDDDPGRVGRMILIGVGLFATLIVTLYVTRLSARAVRSYTQASELSEEPDMVKDTQAPQKPTGKRGVIVMTGIAVVVLGVGTYARMHPQVIGDFLATLAGPPAVAMAEAYTDPPSDQAAVFDHSAFDAVLKKYVDQDGWVDYQALARDTGPLDAYIASLPRAPFDQFGRDEKLAYLINAYNAFTLRLILDHYPIKSIKDIPSAKRWDAVRWKLAAGVSGAISEKKTGGNAEGDSGEDSGGGFGGNSGGGGEPGGVGTYSLNQIEHKLIRPKFKEPRVHFALVCAAYSCPPLRDEVYTGEHLEEQLHDQTVYVHTHDRWFRFDQVKNTVYLTPLYKWYGSDFKSVADSVLDYVADQVPQLRTAMESGRKPKVRWLGYDWKLNSKANKP